MSQREDPYVEVEVCECCGNDPADCICPECPVCSEMGNPKCYAVVNTMGVETNHRLQYSREQLIGQAKLRILRLEEQLTDEQGALEKLEAPDKRVADRIDGYDRDDLGESPDF